MNVLAINSGSSSLKFALFGAEMTPLERGQAKDPQELFSRIGVTPDAIGHRIVHGGTLHHRPCLIDESVMRDLRSLVELAPIHMPPAVEAIEATAAAYPGVPQVACFDTAFHHDLPDVAAHLPIPERFHHAGVRRYGFHSLSYEFIVSALGAELPSRTVIAHLGSGSSLAAVRDGKAIDTTMGFTPDGGVMMGTRTGDIDPGALFFMARRERLSIDELERVALRESGLRGVAGDSDVRALLDRSDERAKLALEMFGYSVKKAIGAMVAALGGLDLLVFTGGVGAHAPLVRTLACEGVFGITLDADRNARNEATIHATSSRVTVRAMTTDEEIVIARHTDQIVAPRSRR